jgi:hypothetical protein
MSILQVKENVFENAVFMYDQNSDPAGIYYFFIVDKQFEDNNWYIYMQAFRRINHWKICGIYNSKNTDHEK